MEHIQFSLADILPNILKTFTRLPTILKGLKVLISVKSDTKMAVPLLVEQHARKQGNKIALISHDSQFTYSELNATANRYAHYFASQGIQKGDTLALMIDNRPELLAAVLGAMKLGAICAMINTAQRNDALMHSLTVVNSKLLIAGTELQEAIIEVKDQLSVDLQNSIYSLKDPKTERLAAEGFIDLDTASQNCDDSNLEVTKTLTLNLPCFYIFTSGTTGLPKAAVMSSFRWFKAMGGTGIASVRLKKDEVFYVPLPFYHNNALTLSWGAALGAGATLAIARKFSASRFWDDVRHFKANSFCYIGELCRYLLNQVPQANDAQHDVRVIIGNGLRPDIWDEFQQRFGIEHINEFYGASECNLMFTNALNLKKTAGFCPLPYKIIAYDIDADEPVRDANGFCIPVEKGQSGLLITAINDRSPFDGYTDAEANNKKLLSNVLEEGDLYFNSGDLVYNQGCRHVAFVDRLGDTFRWKGENVATTEVESVAAHFPGLEHAVVYGIEIPKADGRAGMAALTLGGGAEDFDFKAFFQHMKNNLPAYALPIFLRIQAQQQITGTFKYQKVALKKQAYDLKQVQDPIYVIDKEAGYKRLDEATFNDINKGSISF